MSTAANDFDHPLPAQPQSWPLAVALITSAALHASFLAFYLGSREPAATKSQPASPLEARLADSRESAQVVLASATPAPFAVPAPPEAVPTQPETMSPPGVANQRASTARSAQFGDVMINARPVADRSQLGELFDRQLRDFPVEVDSLPRVASRISVFYPPAALAAGREDVVAVWFIVNQKGEAEEITVTHGSEEFTAAIVAALRKASFVPARNNRVPIAFPLSLEFRFALDAVAPPPAETTAAKSAK